ncbi:MAG TPA: PrsW family glutamic-type intramembrane protease [Chloroflexota bacterium]
MTADQVAAVQSRGQPRRWLQFFVVGLVIWIASVVVTAVTKDPILIPTVVLWGSFLVPVTAVIFDYEHEASRTLDGYRVFTAFVYGGVLGVLVAAWLEKWLVGPGPLQYLGVGLIEEAAKLLALIVVAWSLPRYTMRDGLVLGAAVGFGFGALESSGYAFVSLLSSNGGLSLSNLIFTEVLRGVLAPIGHGLWTGILGAVLFRASRGGQLRITATVVGAYLLVSLLHALWDSMSEIALVITILLTGSSAQIHAITSGHLPQPTTSYQAHVFVTTFFVGFVIITSAGLQIFRRLWLEALQEPSTPQLR